MIRKINILLLTTILSGLFFTSCDNSKTYAELVSEERKAIKKYIKENNIIVLDKLPEDTIFNENEYFLDENGLYIHIESLGGRRMVENGEDVGVWYNKRGPLPSKDLNNTNTDYPKPDYFTYMGSYSNTRYAWYRPLHYVGNYGRVKVIAPHMTGGSKDQTNVEAFAYDLEYILPDGYN